MKPGRRSVTVADVAARANVSPMTVSRVANGAARVSAATRERVERAMRELDYVPNQLARGLASSQLGLVALVIADVVQPWSTSLAEEVEQAAAPAGITLVILSTGGDPARERLALDKLSAIRVDGVLLDPAGPQSVDGVRLLQRRDIPLVLMNREVGTVEADLVQAEAVGPADALTEHLVLHGHRRVAMLAGVRGDPVVRERLRGWRRALQRHGIDPEERDLVRCSGGVEARAAARRLLQAAPPPALVTTDHERARAVLEVAEELGIDIGGSLHLATFDDAEVGAVEPFLTCVELPARRIGRTAFDLLRRRIDGDRGALQHTVVEARVHIRRSCGCAPAPLLSRDGHVAAGGSLASVLWRQYARTAPRQPEAGTTRRVTTS